MQARRYGNCVVGRDLGSSASGGVQFLSKASEDVGILVKEINRIRQGCCTSSGVRSGIHHDGGLSENGT
jgi:hypothetical protein